MRGELANATTDDVAEWVASLGLDEYTRTFKQHSIDGAQLLELTDDQLRGELGISKIGHRARIRRERDVLLARSKPSSAVALRPARSSSSSGGKVKVSLRHGSAGAWVNLRLVPSDLNVAGLRPRIADALSVSEGAVDRLQYRSGADWYAVLRDEDLREAVAESGGKSLVLQIATDDDTNAPGTQLALAADSGSTGGELSIVESKQQVNLLWHGITWHQRLRALLARGEVSEALDALLEWQGARSAMTQSPAAVYNALLKLVNDTNLPSAVGISAYELMRSRGVKPNAATYDHLLRSLIRDGKPEIAARVLVSMEQTGHRPDASAYNGIIQSLADRGGRGDMTMALQIAAKAVEIEVDITLFTFNKMLASCARDASTDEGVSAFKLLQKAGHTADEESYNSLLECTCMGNDVALSMKALKGMINAGYSPRINSVNRMLASCTTSDQASAIFKLTADLQDLQLNSRSYAELMRCVRTEGNLEYGVRSLKMALRAGIYLDGDVVGSIIDMAVEAVDKSEEERLQTEAHWKEETTARVSSEEAQRESEQARLEALALAQANKDEAEGWREQAAAAEDAAAEAVGSFDKFDQEWAWMETIIQDEREHRAAAVAGQVKADFLQVQAAATAEEENAARIIADDANEVAQRAKLVSDHTAAKAVEEAASWREVALTAENAMEDLSNTRIDSEDIDWVWMESAIQDEVVSRTLAQNAQADAERKQTRAEERAHNDTVARDLAEEESEKNARARLVAVAEARASKDETDMWRETAMAAEASAVELAERSSIGAMTDWDFVEALLTDEAAARAMVEAEYDIVMEKIGAAAAAGGTVTAEAAKSLAKGEMDARIAAEKEATAAKETLAASDIRYRAKVEAAEARADKAEALLMKAEKRGMDNERKSLEELQQLQREAQQQIKQAERSKEEEAAKVEAIKKLALEETKKRKASEAEARRQADEVLSAQKAASEARALNDKMEEGYAKRLKEQQEDHKEKIAAEKIAAEKVGAEKATAEKRAADAANVFNSVTEPGPAAASPTTAKKAPPAIPAGKKAVPAAKAKAAAPAAGKTEEGRKFKVVCPGGVLARAEFAMTSKKAGNLKQNETIESLEVRTNDSGVVRVRFSGRISGWCSTKASDGTVLLEELAKPAAKAPAVSKTAPAAASGAKFKAVQTGIVRAGFVMSSKKQEKNLKKGTVIDALETKVNEQGVMRVRFKSALVSGWCSDKAGDGTVLLEKVAGSAKAPAAKAPAAKAPAKAPAAKAPAKAPAAKAPAKAPAAKAKPDSRMIWYADDDEEEHEVTVDKFRAMVRSKKIKPDNEVWMDGVMDDWEPLADIDLDDMLKR